MLVQFALDPAALAGSSANTIQDAANHRRFLGIWLAHGVLMLHSADTGKFVSAIQSLPQSSRKLWKAAFEGRQHRRAVHQGRWRGFHALAQKQDFDELGKAELAVLSDDLLAILDLGEEIPLFINERMEACSYSTIDQSQRMIAVREKAERTIAKGEPTADVWAQRFQRLSATEQSVAVVDRYAFKELWYRSTSGLETFVRLLARDGKSVNLTLYSAQVDNVKDAEIRTALNSLFGSLTDGGISLCHAYWTDASLFGQEAHWRYARFGDAVCQLDPGIEVLQGGGVPRNCTFRFTRRDALVKQSEDTLKNSSGTRHWKIP